MPEKKTLSGKMVHLRYGNESDGWRQRVPSQTLLDYSVILNLLFFKQFMACRKKIVRSLIFMVNEYLMTPVLFPIHRAK